MHPIIYDGTHTEWVQTVRAADFSLEFEAAWRRTADRQPASVRRSPNKPVGQRFAARTCAAGMRRVGIRIRPTTPDGRNLPRPQPVLVGEEYPKARRDPHLSKVLARGGRWGYLIATPAMIEAIVWCVCRIKCPRSQGRARGRTAERASYAGSVADDDRRTRTGDSGVSGRGFRSFRADANFVLFGRCPTAGHLQRSPGRPAS